MQKELNIESKQELNVQRPTFNAQRRIEEILNKERIEYRIKARVERPTFNPPMAEIKEMLNKEKKLNIECVM